MRTHETISIPAVTIGLDLGDRWGHGCVLGADGVKCREFRVPIRQAALHKEFSQYKGARVVLEVGLGSPWVSRLRASLGCEVIVANARRVRLITQSEQKTDRRDAEQLARLGRLDPQLLAPISHRGEAVQKDLRALRVRDGLVRARTQLINQARGLGKALGIELAACSAGSFTAQVSKNPEQEGFPGLEPLVKMSAWLTQEIRTLDRQSERLCQDRYPQTARLRQVTGVGA